MLEGHMLVKLNIDGFICNAVLECTAGSLQALARNGQAGADCINAIIGHCRIDTAFHMVTTEMGTDQVQGIQLVNIFSTCSTIMQAHPIVHRFNRMSVFLLSFTQNS